MKKIFKSIAEVERALVPYVSLVARITGQNSVFERINPLMYLLGSPEESLKAVHIAGTSGKTSTSYYIAALLRASGKRIGLTVSPHIDSITERIQINGQPLADTIFCEEMAEFLAIVEKAPQPPSYFELLYAFALWEFGRQRVDYAVVETGMGGLYDATNVMTRADKVCVLTDIGFDHMAILGNTIEEITAQKVGIVHEDNQLIMFNQGKQVMSVVTPWVKKYRATLLLTTEEKERFKVSADLLPLPHYLQRNWLLAHKTYEYLKQRDGLISLSAEQLKDTQTIRIPARMDIRNLGDKKIVMDGAHNGQKMAAFADSYRELYPEEKPAILLALKNNKEYQDIVPIIADLASQVIVTNFYTSDYLPAVSVDPVELAATFNKAGFQHVRVLTDPLDGLKALLVCPEHSIVITGSFYLISQLRQSGLLKQPK